MKLQQLKYVVKVAEMGNITEASRRLFVSQPSITAAIRDLEHEMGVVIFERTNKGVVITSEGENFQLGELQGDRRAFPLLRRRLPGADGGGGPRRGEGGEGGAPEGESPLLGLPRPRRLRRPRREVEGRRRGGAPGPAPPRAAPAGRPRGGAPRVPGLRRGETGCRRGLEGLPRGRRGGAGRPPGIPRTVERLSLSAFRGRSGCPAPVNRSGGSVSRLLDLVCRLT